jgi:hypothetical protein
MDNERNVATWNKNLTHQIANYLKSENPKEQLVGTALRHFQPSGSVGIEVPTHNVRFIVTSNKALTAPSANLTTQRKMHEAALRDRVAYKDFTLDEKRAWGWIAHLVMDNNVLDLDTEIKQTLLVWMYDNWSRLPATSMRAVQELAALYINHPEDYEAHWEMYLN